MCFACAKTKKSQQLIFSWPSSSKCLEYNTMKLSRPSTYNLSIYLQSECVYGKKEQLKLRSFRGSEHTKKKGDGPYRGFDY